MYRQPYCSLHQANCHDGSYVTLRECRGRRRINRDAAVRDVVTILDVQHDELLDVQNKTCKSQADLAVLRNKISDLKRDLHCLKCEVSHHESLESRIRKNFCDLNNDLTKVVEVEVASQMYKMMKGYNY